MRSRTRIFTIAAAVLLGLSSIYSQGKAPSFSPQNLEFPVVEGWRLGPKSVSPMEELGIVVNYDSPDRERMTVYLYTRGSANIPNELTGVIKEEFEGAKAALKVVADAGIYSNLKVEKSETANVGGTAGQVKALRAVLSFEIAGAKMNSEIFVFPYKGYFVKLRISRPSTLDMGSAAYVKLLSAIDGLFSR